MASPAGLCEVDGVLERTHGQEHAKRKASNPERLKCSHSRDLHLAYLVVCPGAFGSLLPSRRTRAQYDGIMVEERRVVTSATKLGARDRRHAESA